MKKEVIMVRAQDRIGRGLELPEEAENRWSRLFPTEKSKLAGAEGGESATHNTKY